MPRGSAKRIQNSLQPERPDQRFLNGLGRKNVQSSAFTEREESQNVIEVGVGEKNSGDRRVARQNDRGCSSGKELICTASRAKR